MSSENSLTSQNFGSCKHIKYLSKNQASLSSYRAIFENCVAISASKSSLKEAVSCQTCKTWTGRIHACLHCINFSCIEEGHVNQHYRKTLKSHKNETNPDKTNDTPAQIDPVQKHPGHYLYVELLYGNIYCAACRDYVYEDKFESIAQKYMISMSTRAQSRKLRLQAQQHNWNCYNTISDSKKLTIASNKQMLVSPNIPGYKTESSKRKKNKTSPTLEEQNRKNNDNTKLMAAGAQRLIVKKSSYIGLRGLINLGNTCFMNTIIQSLVHTSTLRDYFLSEQFMGQCGHDKDTYSKNDSKNDKNCIVCEMNRVFQQFYGGATSPYCPDRLLYLVWTQARHLAGYEQQDAHEFLIALLDLMHQHLAPRSSTPTNRALWEPPVTMIDRIFTGRLQSDVICTFCGNVSTTVDPFSDISLDIKGGANGETTDVVSCLRHFTRAEQLGPQCKINCSKCRVNRESKKQLSINLLPIVVCLHFKRFEQSHMGNGRKISSFVAFPEELSMNEFMAEKVSQKHVKELYNFEDLSSDDQSSNLGDDSNQSEPTNPEVDSLYGESKEKRLKVDSESDLRFVYSLYAVVMHSGNLQGGHYTAFVKKSGEWFSCNDHTIKKIAKSEVLNSQAYLLFYHKMYLEYS